MVLVGMGLALMAGCETKMAPAEAGISDTIIKHIVIDAPPATVSNYMWIKGVSVDDSGRATVEWVPEYKCEDYQGKRGQIGRSCQATLEVAGTDYRSEYVVIRHVPNIDGTLTYFLAPHEKGSRLTEVFEYSVENLKGVSKQEFKKALEEIVERGFNTIKQKAEKMPAAKSAGAAGETLIVSDSFVKSIVINAPVEKVFSYMEDPERYAEWGTVQRISGKGEGVGMTSEWENEVEGTVYRCQTVYVEYLPNQKTVAYFTCDNAGGVDTFRWLPADGKTRVIKELSYSAEIPKDEQINEQKIIRAVREGHEQSLQKVKAAVER
jgi:uncharacterized protein YndB with AHSA1/START domain